MPKYTRRWGFFLTYFQPNLTPSCLGYYLKIIHELKAQVQTLFMHRHGINTCVQGQYSSDWNSLFLPTSLRVWRESSAPAQPAVFRAMDEGTLSSVKLTAPGQVLPVPFRAFASVVHGTESRLNLPCNALSSSPLIATSAPFQASTWKLPFVSICNILSLTATSLSSESQKHVRSSPPIEGCIHAALHHALTWSYTPCPLPSRSLWAPLGKTTLNPRSALLQSKGYRLPGALVKSEFQFSGSESEAGPEMLHFKPAPKGAGAAAPWASC